jgi:hypothetical protein
MIKECCRYGKRSRLEPKLGCLRLEIFKLTLRNDFKGMRMAGIHLIISRAFCGLV